MANSSARSAKSNSKSSNSSFMVVSSKEESISDSDSEEKSESEEEKSELDGLSDCGENMVVKKCVKKLFSMFWGVSDPVMRTLNYKSSCVVFVLRLKR